MKYQLICIDLDGTLLDRKQKINPRTIEVLKKAHQEGIHIVISTGRLYSDAEHYSKLLGVDSPIIASNGSIIKDTGERQSIYINGFDESLITRIYEVVNQHNQKLSVYTSDKMYISNFKIFSLIYYERLMNKGNNKTKLRYIFTKKHFKRILKKERNQILKCEVFDYNLERIETIRRSLKMIDAIETVSSVDFCIEITKKGVSKGDAVKILSEYYGINRQAIIAIGDSENDLTMIEYANMGVAMGNASEVLKNKANYITDTNDELGVAKAVEALLYA